MTILILGLLVFLGVHSVRIVAEDWRSAQITRIGIWPWKGLYSLVAIAGFVLIVWGYGMTRPAPELWHAPAWLRMLASILVLVSFVLIVAAYIPRNHIKAAIGHPMVAGAKLWAFAHLLTNSRPGDWVLFGAFLLWAIFDFRAGRRRDRAAGRTYPAGSVALDLIVVLVGVAAWAAFAWYLHERLIGTPVFA